MAISNVQDFSQHRACRAGLPSSSQIVNPQRPRFPSRRGTTNPLVIALLVLILIALVALVIVVAIGGSGPQKVDGKPPKPAVKSGETVDRKDLPDPPKPPERAVNDTKRIKETLQAGKTYEVTVKAGFTARVEDKDWGVRGVTNLSYLGEARITRKIESNDGRRIVELRRFRESRNVKVLCEVESVAVDLGLPGQLVLGAIDYLQPGTIATVEVAQPLVELFFKHVAQGAVENSAKKAVAHIDTLAGKTVRITYIDGVGVNELTPVGCDLTASERDFIFATAALSDCYIFPELNIEPGKSWTVDGRQLVNMLDPSLRGIPEGDVEIERTEDQSDEGKRYAGLRIRDGFVRLVTSDNTTHRIGTFSPRGSLRYSLDDQHVSQADLTGDITIEQVSKDHILFEASYRTQPTMKVNYDCRIVP